MIVFAKLIMSLCCNNLSAVHNVHKSLEILGRHFSSDVKNVIHLLMTPPGPLKVRTASACSLEQTCNFLRFVIRQTIQGLFDTFGNRLVAEVDAAHRYVLHFWCQD
jgi:PAB-dependent poly(A)-specific ribonuclease subunit 3